MSVLGGAAVASARRAQQAGMPVVGFPNSASPEPYADRGRVFHQVLSLTGYVEGGNFRIEFYAAEGHNNDVPALEAVSSREPCAMLIRLGFIGRLHRRNARW
jgi:putative ABC transport system substrate-binding protein